MMRRKGQFFMVGAIIIAIMLTDVFVVQNRAFYGQDNTKFVFDNTKTEWEKMITTVTTEEWTSRHVEDRLYTHTMFTDGYMKRRSLNFTQYFIVGLPYSSHMNVTVGNFMKAQMTNVSVTIEGTSYSQTQNLGNLSHDTIVTRRFTDVPSTINVSYSFETTDALASEFQTTKRVFSIIGAKVENPEVTLIDVSVK